MREKLIELIASTEYGNGLVGENFQDGFIAKIADHLIANGVTLDNQVSSSKWIPVTERLPEEMEWVLCACVDREVHILRYDYLMDDWDIHHRPNACYGRGFVTHWMPLPEPPREDQ